MYNETTLIVNVDATSKKLSDTAVNMWIANEVVLELDQPDAPDVESGKSFYAQMTKKVLSDGAQGVTDGYYFTFDTGDVFFSATANGYPELVGGTLKIGTGNGVLPPITDADDGKVLTADSGKWVPANPSGGGVLVVHETDTTPAALDKTWKEIHDAVLGNGAVIIDLNEQIGAISFMNIVEGVYSIFAHTNLEYYFTDTENGYPHANGMH